MDAPAAQAILDFWFNELSAKQHFVKEAALDDTIRTRFGDTLVAAAQRELFTWRATAEGRLAEIIVMDQFSRNIYRDTQLGIPNNLNFELRHKAIIDRFGRYPHRSAILGRSSSTAELAFLSEPGSSF